MSEKALKNLNDMLNQPTDVPIDDAMLAEVATAEVAGQDVEQLYPEVIRLIESSESLADTYAELVEMVTISLVEMAVAADNVAPEEVTAAIASAKPVVWGQHVKLKKAIKELEQGIQHTMEVLFSKPLAHATLSGTSDNDNWEWFDVYSGDVFPLRIQASLTKQSDTTSKLTVSVLEGVRQPVEGCVVTVRYHEYEATAVSNDKGLAFFESLQLLDRDLPLEIIVVE